MIPTHKNIFLVLLMLPMLPIVLMGCNHHGHNPPQEHVEHWEPANPHLQQLDAQGNPLDIYSHSHTLHMPPIPQSIQTPQRVEGPQQVTLVRPHGLPETAPEIPPESDPVSISAMDPETQETPANNPNGFSPRYWDIQISDQTLQGVAQRWSNIENIQLVIRTSKDWPISAPMGTFAAEFDLAIQRLATSFDSSRTKPFFIYCRGNRVLILSDEIHQHTISCKNNQFTNQT